MFDYADKRPQYFDGPRRAMLAFVPLQARRILEIGCGDGRFAASLKARGPVEITGIELNAEAGERARARMDLVHVADLETAPPVLPQAYFDCLICNDVLEHLRDPWQVLRHLRASLVPGAKVVASLPNLRFLAVMKDLLLRGDFSYQDEGVLDRTHLRFFTRRTLRALFEDSGYEVVQLQGINSRVRGWKFDLLDKLTGGRVDDMRYVQFAVVAQLPGAAPA